ncbi:MAG TPA: hypothetical protein VFM18_18090 [Methanosarcina sp.]|nr:hypothetical protein [Methanosarcina sp.]
MSHSYHANKDTIFIFNSDMSGPVLIRNNNKEIEIPGDDLMEFLVSRLRHARACALDNASDDDILAGKV